MHYGEGLLSGTSNPNSRAGLSNSSSHGLRWWEWEMHSFPKTCPMPQGLPDVPTGGRALDQETASWFHCRASMMLSWQLHSHFTSQVFLPSQSLRDGPAWSHTAGRLPRDSWCLGLLVLMGDIAMEVRGSEKSGPLWKKTVRGKDCPQTRGFP